MFLKSIGKARPRGGRPSRVKDKPGEPPRSIKLTATAGRPYNRDRAGAIVRALADGPKHSGEIAALTGLDRREISHALCITTRLFRRTDPNAPTKNGCPAVYELVPEADRPAVPKCRHCGIKSINRPRRLCWVCYYTPGVKELYPSTSKYARRGLDGPTSQPVATTPTDAIPGTPEKVAVMAARVAAGFQPFHPGDGPRACDGAFFPTGAAERGAA